MRERQTTESLEHHSSQRRDLFTSTAYRSVKTRALDTGTDFPRAISAQCERGIMVSVKCVW